MKEAAEAVRRSLPEIVYLFASFFRRRAAKFSAISENGPLFRRVMLTATLAVVCGLASYIIVRLDPFDGLEGIMPPQQRAFWTALAPLIAALLAYWLVRRPFTGPILSTFLNLGFVTCTALVVIPGILSLAGANLSALAGDIRQLRAGRGEGTPVHAIYCTTIQERAEIDALMRRLIRNSEQLAQNGRLLMANTQSLAQNTQQLAPNARRLRILKAQIDQAGGPGRVNPEVLQAFLDTMSEGLPIVQQGMALSEQGLILQNQSMALHREGLATQYRALDLRYRQTTAPYRLLGAYPIATAFLVVAMFTGLLMWLFAGVIAWRLVVSPQPTRRRKWLAGLTVVLIFVLVMLGLGLLRSGLLEILLQELPSREMLEAQLRTQFEMAAPMCGRLDNHGLW